MAESGNGPPMGPTAPAPMSELFGSSNPAGEPVSVVEITGDGGNPHYFWAGSELNSWFGKFESLSQAAEMKKKLETLPDRFSAIGGMKEMRDILKGSDACTHSIVVSRITPRVWTNIKKNEKWFANYFDTEQDLPDNGLLVSIDIDCSSSRETRTKGLLSALDSEDTATPAPAPAPAKRTVTAKRTSAREQAAQAQAAQAQAAQAQSAQAQAAQAQAPQTMSEAAARLSQLISQTPAAALSGDPTLAYPIVKLVAVSITHGSSIGEITCEEVPYPTDDFRNVFFYGNQNEDIYFDDPKFDELFSSKRRPFAPNETTVRILLGTDRPKCRYVAPNVYLPPMLFSTEPTGDEDILVAHNRALKKFMGLYLYVFRQNPVDDKLYIQKLKVASHDDLDPGIYITYSIIFDKFHRYIKANAELLGFMRRARNPLTVGFFCCRGAHLREMYNPFNIASIKNPHTELPPLPIIFDTTRDVLPPDIMFPRLYLHTMSPAYDLKTLQTVILGGQPLLSRGMRNMNWQSCLYNLFVFFNIISRESADALASVSSFQQIRQLSSNRFIVSGESTQEAIRILNGLIPPNINRMFIVQRSPILLGIYKIMSVLIRLAFRNTYVVFAKVYPKEFVPTEPSIPSQIGHWIAIARFANSDMYYVDVQSSQYISIPPLTPANEAFIYQEMIRIFAPYVVMDLLYISTNDKPYFVGPNVLNLQLPQPQQPQPQQPQSQQPSSDGGGLRRYRMSKKRKFKSKTKTRTRTKTRTKTRQRS